MEFIQVSNKIMGMGRHQVTFRMDHKIRMVTLVSKEGCDAGSGAGGVVVCELHEGQKAGPVVLLVIAVYPEVLFKGLISALSLPITFRMIARCEVQLHVKGHAQGLEEVQDELCA